VASIYERRPVPAPAAFSVSIVPERCRVASRDEYVAFVAAQPDAAQWALLRVILESHPEAMRVEQLRRFNRHVDIDETIARLLIDGLAIRFGDWVKASDAAARLDQLARTAAPADRRLAG
jgi:hypothetical protein